jgi:hypothetical protein
VPRPDAGRLPLVPLLKYGSYEQLLDKLTGALLALPQSSPTLSAKSIERAADGSDNFCPRAKGETSLSYGLINKDDLIEMGLETRGKL